MVLSILNKLTLAVGLIRDLITRTAAFDYSAKDQKSIPYVNFEQAHFRTVLSYAAPLLFIVLEVFIVIHAKSLIMV